MSLYADELAGLMGDRTLTEYLAAEHSAVAVARALSRLGKEVAKDRGAAEAYLALSRQLQPALQSVLRSYTAEERDELSVTSLWSAIPRSIYIQSSEPDRLFLRGIDGHLFDLPFDKELQNAGMTNVYSAQNMMTFVLPESLEKYVGPQQMFWMAQFKHELSAEMVSTDLYDPQDGLEVRYSMQVDDGDSSLNVTFRYADTSVGTTAATTTSLKFEGVRVSY